MSVDRTRQPWAGAFARGGVPLLAAVLAAGCSQELGPEPMPTASVRGVVREGSRPVGGGWVEFLPTDGTVGTMRSAPIGPDGTFRADGVPVGPVRVAVNGAPVSLPGARRLFDSLQSTIVRTIPPASAAPHDLDLDLVPEYYRTLAERSQGGEP